MKARLQLLARALGAPGLQLQARAGAGRWRGRPDRADTLTLDPRAAPRQARLQVLRHVLDLRPDGRHALRLSPTDDRALIGPLARPEAEWMDLTAVLASWPHPRLLARLFLLRDGLRVDQLLAETYPGACNDLALDTAPANADQARPVDARDALVQALQRYRGLLADRPLRRGRGLALADLLGVDTAGAPGGGHGPGPGPASAVGSGPWSAHTLPESEGTGGGQPGHAPPGHARLGKLPADSNSAAAAGGPVRLAAPSPASRVTLHPEWDFRLAAYRPGWVTVQERALSGHPPAAAGGADERQQRARRRLRRRLEASMADAPRRLRAQDDGIAIDLDAALEAGVDRRTGHAPSRSGLYLAAPRRARDLAVALLVDASASTDHVLQRPPPATEQTDDDTDEPLWQLGPAPPVPGPPSRRVIDVFKDAAALLAEVLQAQGDRSALFAFSGDGRQQVDFLALKRFDEAWAAPAQAAVAALRPLGSTRTGAAVRHAALQLHRADARRRVLIVLSDGYPQDRDYGRHPDDREHGLHDTARALREAESAGIGVLNVSVDVAAHDYLRRLCPRHRYLVMHDIDALPDRLVQWWQRLTRGAR